MNPAEIAAITSAGAAMTGCIIAVASFWNSQKALESARKTTERSLTLDREISRRQQVLLLYDVWKPVRGIDCNNLIGPHVVTAVNALTLTATAWNHDIIDRTILIQTYWPSFEQVFEQLWQCAETAPGQKRACQDLLSRQVQIANSQMRDKALALVQQSSLNEPQEKGANS